MNEELKPVKIDKKKWHTGDGTESSISIVALNSDKGFVSMHDIISWNVNEANHVKMMRAIDKLSQSQFDKLMNHLEEITKENN